MRERSIQVQQEDWIDSEQNLNLFLEEVRKGNGINYHRKYIKSGKYAECV